MNEDKLKRRRFLADMLFAGSALAGLGLLASHVMPTPEPHIETHSAGKVSAPTTPHPQPAQPSPLPQPAGAPVPPRPATPFPTMPRAKGESAMPVLDGDVKLPAPGCKKP